MNKFEEYLKTTPEYKTLLLQHGERLFIQRDGEYEILTIRLAHRIWMRTASSLIPQDMLRTFF